MNRRKMLRHGWFGDTVSYVYLTILAVIAIFPLLWIILSSLKGKGEIASKETLNTICKLLQCQPGDILEYIEDEQ